jgi:membrane associated rhomboid family serine protease
MEHSMPTDSSEVFRSAWRAACEERAFMLLAVTIDSSISLDGWQFVLSVAGADTERALNQLRQYETERRPVPPAPVPGPHRGNAWVGATLYVLVLMGVALAISKGWWRADAFTAGTLEGSRVHSGQWWRAWTALTLHLDGNHLFANLGAGTWFGFLAARQLGSGNAWLLIVTGAALANWLEAWFGPASHRAVGASTAVFTALGLLAAHTWRTRFHVRQNWAGRWGPLIAGIVLLGWLGTEGEGTDLVAHAAGFAVGCLMGTTVALAVVERALRQVPQWLAGLVTLASIALAWICALHS